MAPYLGLLNRGEEISVRGYTRKDLSDIAFRISPRDDNTLIVLNWDAIAWQWNVDVNWHTFAVTDIAVFADIIGDEIMTTSPLSGLDAVAPCDQIMIGPGGLRFDHHFSNDGNTVTNVASLRAALEQIARAPHGTSAFRLQLIARKALAAVDSN